jgi:hypothetical protein
VQFTTYIIYLYFCTQKHKFECQNHINAYNIFYSYTILSNKTRNLCMYLILSVWNHRIPHKVVSMFSIHFLCSPKVRAFICFLFLYFNKWIILVHKLLGTILFPSCFIHVLWEGSRNEGNCGFKGVWV